MHELECVIRGAAFGGRRALDTLARLEVGQPCRLKRDDSNTNDRHAVQVLFMGVQIGWVPRELNQPLANAIDAGATPAALCTRAVIFSRGGRINQEAMIKITWEDHPR